MDKTGENWSENVIIADGDYVDSVAFNLIVNFERMLGRRIPQADMARWIDCVALDGGVREGNHETQVILIHRKPKMENFAPADYETELNGKAFRDNLGEFAISAYEQTDIEGQDLMAEAIRMVMASADVKRLMIVPDERQIARLRHLLDRNDDEKRTTVFVMEPGIAGNCRQEILGYSLMNALGIRSEEIEQKQSF